MKTVPPEAHLELVLVVVVAAVVSSPPRASDGRPPRVRRRHRAPGAYRRQSYPPAVELRRECPPQRFPWVAL